MKKKTQHTHINRDLPGQEQLRCCCGKLLAKQVGGRLVIRCSRCKQEIQILIPQESL